MNEALSRSAALLGDDAMKRLAAARVLLIGTGGVGGWCAEALARTGVGHLTIVDDDTVAESNLNRQCPATLSTIGRFKAEVMAERIRDIAPDCSVTAETRRWEEGPIGDYDIVIDAIDSVGCKANLVLSALDAKIPVISSMGAALRTDPLKIVSGPFEKVTGDGLARALREKFKKLGRRPGRFDCVWSLEQPVKSADAGTKGSLMQVTAAFGMALAAKALARLTAE